MAKYIEAEELINALFQNVEDLYQRGWNDALRLAINYAPTADVQKVRHGRWVDVEPAPHNLFYATCSVCGDRQTIEVANYCPMCGASLDKVEE